MSAVVLIPARYNSTRFPGKLLAPLKGMPLIQHAYMNSSKSLLSSDVIVATDNKEIHEQVLSFGGKCVMTSSKHLSGTDRIAEVARSLSYDIIVNVQGDEPLIKPTMIDDVISVLEDKRASVGTLAVKIRDYGEIFNPNVVKVVFDEDGIAFYFSRAPIPYHRDEWRQQSIEHSAKSKDFSSSFGFRPQSSEPQAFYCYKHIGIYSYRRDVLIKLSELPQSRLEVIEKLEQLRALENNYKIRVKETTSETFGVDTPEDLERIDKWLNSSL
jgi:3-deoxy-manno-octulosonate cytidylyltransferase (CMP-KDO synthetase)